MGEKQDLIAKIIALQKKAIQQMRAADESPDADADDEPRSRTEEGEAMAMRVVELAHREQKTAR